MRKVVSYLLYSLDGVVESPDNWVFDKFDDEMMGHLKAIISRQDAVLLGRKTYDDWSSYWPTSTHEPFASFINNSPKYVAARRLTPTWERTSVLAGDVARAVDDLKKSPGGEIGVHGSPTLVRYLIDHGMLDELILAVFPAAAGRGQRLFDAETTRRLDVLSAETTERGVVILRLQPSPA